jgi:hypothetical protein
LDDFVGLEKNFQDAGNWLELLTVLCPPFLVPIRLGNVPFPESEPRMFGKPEWFANQKGKLGFRPVHWKGWAYFGSFGAAVLVPSSAMLVTGKWIEAGVWSVLSASTFAFDWIKTRRRASKEYELANLFYIDGGDEEVSTPMYFLSARNSK